jgi:uncharacterized protein (TIGR03790 family)
MKRPVLLFLAMVVPHFALALGPHEVLLLVNDRSPDSVEIGREFARLRGIPESNVVRLDIGAAGSQFEITPADFARLIWQPAEAAVKARKLDDHILAWVYSVDFPLRVRADPPLSIQGLTFLRNRMPDGRTVEKGTAVSALYAGPDGEGEGSHCSQSLDFSVEWRGRELPLPSMMLGYMGERGNTKEQIKKSLNRGASSDGTAPTGTVFFVKSDDIRSRCREWQYVPAKVELGVLRVSSAITTTFPKGCPGVMGLMMGTDTVNAEQGNTYMPGCVAEHLTSAAGDFPAAHQTKLSAWIAAGATASAGTVTEPYSTWTKFPSARLYVHYAGGCTLIESYFQAIRCPLQIVLVGDPLARPWAPKAELAIRRVEVDKAAGEIHVGFEIKARRTECFLRTAFLIDGKTAAGARADSRPEAVLPPGEWEYRVKTAGLAMGKHRLRVVAYQTGLVRHQVFGEKDFEL